MKNVLYLVPVFAVAATLYFLYAQQAAELDTSGKLAFSIHADGFYNALLEAGEKRLSVEFGPDRWAVLKDGKVLRRGEWKNGERLGSNIPGLRIYFDGACRTGTDDTCSGYEIAIASNVNRIYTIMFDTTGKPIIAYDDF